MKPQNKKQKQIIAWSKKLDGITPNQKAWAIEHCIKHHARVTKKTIECFTCGHKWENNVGPLIMSLTGCDCPNCGNHLEAKYRDSGKLKNDMSWSYRQSDYMTVFTVSHGYQLLRHYYITSFHAKGDARTITIHEVVQDWITPKGVHTIVACKANQSWYYDGWSYGDKQIRIDGRGKYAIDKFQYPRKRLLPNVKRFIDVAQIGIKETPTKIMKYCLQDMRMEIIYKSGYHTLFQYLMQKERNFMKQMLDICWDSFKICLRNKYVIPDARMWVDHICMLKRNGKDLRNKKFVCAKDLRTEHQKYIEKEQAIKARQEEQEMLKQIDVYEKAYAKHVQRFKDLIIQGSEFVIVPIPSVLDVYKEGIKLHHCVFTNKYFERSNSLLLSARIDEDKRMETIEVNIDRLQVSQSHGLQNQDSKFHKEIVTLVNANMHMIKEIMKPKKKSAFKSI